MSEAGASRPSRIDVAVVVPLVALVVLGTWGVGHEADPDLDERAIDWLAYACGIVGCASLLFWRRWSVCVTGVVALTMFVYLARNYPGGPALLPGPLVLLALGYTAPRRTAWLGAAGLSIAAAVGGTIGRGFGLQGIVAAGWAFAAVLGGQAIAGRRERFAAERERVAHAHEQALANERLRIAQDVHDSVAHAMATINVQSGVAAHLIERRPEQAATALEAIRVASRDALDELGTILGVLRQAGADAPLAPVARIDDVAGLVERARADGLAVTLTARGDGSGVSSAVATAVFRVVQEALTNARRHAGARASVEVDLVIGELDEVQVVVVNDGGTVPRVAIPASGCSGFGLIGMRERVEASGGSLEAGPSADGGFRVVATWKSH